MGLIPSGSTGEVGVDELIGPNVKFTLTRFLKKIGTISPKPEGHDGEVVAAQAQRRGAEQRAEDRGDGGREQEDHRERQVDPRESGWHAREQDDRHAAEVG